MAALHEQFLNINVNLLSRQDYRTIAVEIMEKTHAWKMRNVKKRHKTYVSVSLLTTLGGKLALGRRASIQAAWGGSPK
jgi:hypothetical protein